MGRTVPPYALARWRRRTELTLRRTATVPLAVRAHDGDLVEFRLGFRPGFRLGFRLIGGQFEGVGEQFAYVPNPIFLSPVSRRPAWSPIFAWGRTSRPSTRSLISRQSPRRGAAYRNASRGPTTRGVPRALNSRCPACSDIASMAPSLPQPGRRRARGPQRSPAPLAHSPGPSTLRLFPGPLGGIACGPQGFPGDVAGASSGLRGRTGASSGRGPLTGPPTGHGSVGHGSVIGPGTGLRLPAGAVTVPGRLVGPSSGTSPLTEPGVPGLGTSTLPRPTVRSAPRHRPGHIRLHHRPDRALPSDRLSRAAFPPRLLSGAGRPGLRSLPQRLPGHVTRPSGGLWGCPSPGRLPGPCCTRTRSRTRASLIPGLGLGPVPVAFPRRPQRPAGRVGGTGPGAVIRSVRALATCRNRSRVGIRPVGRRDLFALLPKTPQLLRVPHRRRHPGREPSGLVPGPHVLPGTPLRTLRRPRSPTHASLRNDTRSVSSRSPSSVRAASPEPRTASERARFDSSISAMRSSTVPSVMRRCTWTGWVCPMR